VRERARDRNDVDDVGGPRGLEQREEGARAPDASKVDGVDDVLDLLGPELEEPAPARVARVVHEEPQGRVALGDPGGDLVHLRAVGDVAHLGLGSDLRCDLLQELGAPREEDAPPAARCEQARGRSPDAARSSRDDCDSHGATIDSRRLG
jgi:hypothetical protein